MVELRIIRWGRTQRELIAFARPTHEGSHHALDEPVAACFLSVSVAGGVRSDTQGTNQEGESLYTERCAKCHESGVPRAANREALRRLSPDAIRLALTTGSMRTQGAELTPAQIDSSLACLGLRPWTAASASGDNACAASPASSFANALDARGGTGGAPTCRSTDSSRQTMAQLPANQVPRLKLKWAFGFPGVNRAFAQPTVVGGRVFVGSATGMVYSLNAEQRVPVLVVQDRRSRPYGDHDRARQRDHGGKMDCLLR